MSKRTDLKVSLLFLIFSLLAWFALVPTISEEWRQGAVAGDEYFTLGPRFFPGISALLLGLVSLGLLLQSTRGSTQEAEPPTSAEDGSSLMPVGAALGIGVAYVVALPWAGVLMATPLCLIVYFFYFGVRNWLWLFVFPVFVTAFIYLIFDTLMMVSLPEGVVL